jgi:PadR family transcriptional regulator PadR
MKETTLYSAFARLEKLGCIRPYPGTYSGGRERTYYTLTEIGRQHYAQKCAEWELTKELIINFIKREDEL